MSKLVVEKIQNSGGAELTIPSADGSANHVLKTDGSGNLAFADIATLGSSGTPNLAKNIGGTSGSSDDTGKIMWTDVKAGVSTDDIIAVRITGRIVNASSGVDVYMYGLNSSGSNITSGYLAYGSNDYYDGNNETNNQSHNSNNGWIWFPQYQEPATEGYSYGEGIMFQMLIIPQRYGTYGGIETSIWYHYQQNTSYNHPNYGQIHWRNYGTSAPPDTWHGIRFFPSSNSGSFSTSAGKGSRVFVELLGV